MKMNDPRYRDAPCLRCKGSGEELDLGKTALGVASMGVWAILNMLDDDHPTNKTCEMCDGSGRVRIRYD